MRRLFGFVVLMLLLATLPGCESARSGGALPVVLDAAPELDAALDAAPDAAREPRRRCAHCGWIESKREIRPGADPHAAGVYEYTVRMADGSSSEFRETLPASWRLGERLILVAGARR